MKTDEMTAEELLQYLIDMASQSDNVYLKNCLIKLKDKLNLHINKN